MKKRAFILAAACASVVAIGAQSAGAAPGNVTCTDAFSGTAANVTVPAENFCDLSGATVTNDVLIGREAGIFAEGLRVGHDVRLPQAGSLELGGTTIGNNVIAGSGGDIHLERTTIGVDLVAVEPGTVQMGGNAPDSPGGPVRIGYDLLIRGWPGFDFVFDGICNAHVGHDFRITGRSVTLGFGIGDNCQFLGEPANTVGHDLVVAGNTALVGFFGPSALEVGGNHIGHDLKFVGNRAPGGGYLEVSDNVVGHDAICAGNSPALSTDGPWDGPNTAGNLNTCG